MSCQVSKSRIKIIVTVAELTVTIIFMGFFQSKFFEFICQAVLMAVQSDERQADGNQQKNGQNKEKGYKGCLPIGKPDGFIDAPCNKRSGQGKS